MNFSLSKDQKLIKSSAREFLEKECPKDLVREIVESERGHSEELWNKMADNGWMSMSIPEEFGGLGGTSSSIVELALLLEEMGYSLLPSAFFSTVVLGALPILHAGTPAQKRSILPGVSDGKIKIALGLVEACGTLEPWGVETEAKAEAGGYKITGRKLFVEHGNIADYFLCAARTSKGRAPSEGITLFLLRSGSPGTSVKTIPTIGLKRQCEVRFDGVHASREDIIGEPGLGWPILESVLERAAVAKSAEMLGAMEACLGMTTAYVKQRVQYGRTIGSFQVIQHYLANIWIDSVTSRDLVYKAASTIDAGLPCRTLASMAKAWVGRAFSRTTERCVQMHGAIGTTKEHDISLYYRQAKAWDLAFGSAEDHLSWIGDAFGKV